MAGVAVRFDPGSVAVVGLIAGSICAAFETRAAAVLTGTEFAAMPLRMIAAIVPGAVGPVPTPWFDTSIPPAGRMTASDEEMRTAEADARATHLRSCKEVTGYHIRRDGR
jgi:hypothetical protein